jgi:hypothetical protein
LRGRSELLGVVPREERLCAYEGCCKYADRLDFLGGGCRFDKSFSVIPRVLKDGCCRPFPQAFRAAGLSSSAAAAVVVVVR